jgi:hypothetical protein
MASLTIIAVQKRAMLSADSERCNKLTTKGRIIPDHLGYCQVLKKALEPTSPQRFHYQ